MKCQSAIIYLIIECLPSVLLNYTKWRRRRDSSCMYEKQRMVSEF